MNDLTHNHNHTMCVTRYYVVHKRTPLFVCHAKLSITSIILYVYTCRPFFFRFPAYLCRIHLVAKRAFFFSQLIHILTVNYFNFVDIIKCAVDFISPQNALEKKSDFPTCIRKKIECQAKIRRKIELHLKWHEKIAEKKRLTCKLLS